MKRILLLSVMLFGGVFQLLSQQTNANPKPILGSFTDFRDNKVYKTVKLGNQIWLGYNLNFEMPGSYCYNDTAELCKTYGRLYEWEAAKKACPTGWHLPSDTEWVVLINTLGGKSIAGGKLKEAGVYHWLDPNQGADNWSGLKVLPAGFRSFYPEGYHNLQKESYFWSSTPITNRDDYGWYLLIHYESESTFIENLTLADKKQAFSVRCLKN